MTKRLTWVDTARGISIFLVVLVHASDWAVMVGLASSEKLIAFNNAAAAVRMPLFFAMAGLFAAKWASAAWIDLFNRKILLLLWVFLVWQPVVLGYKTIAILVLLDGDSAGLRRELDTFLLSPILPNGELWFLWVLAIYFVVNKAVAGLHPAWVISIAAMISVFSSTWLPALVSFETALFVGSGWMKMGTFFIFFYLASRYRVRIVEVVGRLTMIGAVSIVMVWILVFVVAYPTYASWLTISESLRQFTGIFAGISAGVLLSRLGVIAYLGARTLPVYLVHTAVIALVVVIARANGVAGLGGVTAAFIIGSLAVIGVLAGLILDRYFGRTWILQKPGFLTLTARGTHRASGV